MTQLLAKYLQAAFAGPHRVKEIAETIPKELTHWHNGEVMTVRDLLLSEGVESTSLIQTEMYATVMEGAEPVKCMREALPILRAKSNVLRVPLGETGSYAAEVAEGAPIPQEVQDYGYRDFTIKKYGVRPKISNEMIEDSQFDVISLEVQKAGMKIENLLNQQALSLILQNSANSVDCGGSGGTPVAKLAEGIGGNQTDGYQSDVIILHPGMAGAVMSAFTSVATAFGDQITKGGMVGTMLGCRMYVTGVTDDSATYTWGWGTDNYIGGLVISSKYAGATAMRRDIQIEQYKDPVRDLLGCSVTARMGFNYLFANATCRVLY